MQKMTCQTLSFKEIFEILLEILQYPVTGTLESGNIQLEQNSLCFGNISKFPVQWGP